MRQIFLLYLFSFFITMMSCNLHSGKNGKSKNNDSRSNYNASLNFGNGTTTENLKPEINKAWESWKNKNYNENDGIKTILRGKNITDFFDMMEERKPKNARKLQQEQVWTTTPEPWPTPQPTWPTKKPTTWNTPKPTTWNTPKPTTWNTPKPTTWNAPTKNKYWDTWDKDDYSDLDCAFSEEVYRVLKNEYYKVDSEEFDSTDDDSIHLKDISEICIEAAEPTKKPVWDKPTPKPTAWVTSTTKRPTHWGETEWPTQSPTWPTPEPTWPTQSPTWPTPSPTWPTESPTQSPTWPTESPTQSPTWPTESPTPSPAWPTPEWPTTKQPTWPTAAWTTTKEEWPTEKPAEWPTTKWPSEKPTYETVDEVSLAKACDVTYEPCKTIAPTPAPAKWPTDQPTWPTEWPTRKPTVWGETYSPTWPTPQPTWPTEWPTPWPTDKPTDWPTPWPTKKPTWPTPQPTWPTEWPTKRPTVWGETYSPTWPTPWPTNKPTDWPTASPTFKVNFYKQCFSEECFYDGICAMRERVCAKANEDSDAWVVAVVVPVAVGACILCCCCCAIWRYLHQPKRYVNLPDSELDNSRRLTAVNTNDNIGEFMNDPIVENMNAGKTDITDGIEME